MPEPQEVKMYSDYKSPYAYLAFDPAFALEKRYRVKVRWIPFQLRLKGKGERSAYSEYKVRYSYLDARRWAKPRGLCLRGPLKIFDTTPALIGGLLAERYGLLLPYSRKIFELFFRRELEVDQPEAVAKVIESVGISGIEYRDYLAGDGPKDYERAQEEAADDHIFGVPMTLFRGEPFWGYDRLELLERRLAESGLRITEAAIA